jgi:hypothetical protein
MFQFNFEVYLALQSRIRLSGMIKLFECHAISLGFSQPIAILENKAIAKCKLWLGNRVICHSMSRQ